MKVHSQPLSRLALLSIQTMFNEISNHLPDSRLALTSVQIMYKADDSIAFIAIYSKTIHSQMLSRLALAAIQTTCTASHSIGIVIHSQCAGSHSVGTIIHSQCTGSHSIGIVIHSKCKGSHSIGIVIHSQRTGSHSFSWQ